MTNDELIACFVSINALRDSMQECVANLNDLQTRIIDIYEREYEKNDL